MDFLLDRGEMVVYRVRMRWVAYVSAGVIFALAMMPGRISGLVSSELLLTDKRLLARTGLLSRQDVSWRYADIETARARQGWLGMLFDYGSITITNKRGERMVLRGIAEPVDVQMRIEEAVEIAVLGHVLSQTAMEKWPV